MSNSFPLIFLVLAAVVVVFGFGVVLQARRKKPTPVIEAAPKKVVAPEPVVEEVEAAPVIAPVVEKKRSFKNVLAGAVSSVLGRGEINDTSWDDLEEALLRADVGVKVAQALLEPLRARVKAKEISTPAELITALQNDMSSRLVGTNRELNFDASIDGPNIWLMVGVNGAGKTTSLGKISAQQVALGRKVLMAAGDTFRAAAGEQLQTWAERSGAEIIRGAEGSDPSSVIFDAVQAANARKFDLVLADTAGRLQNNTNLMEELRKVRRVA